MLVKPLGVNVCVVSGKIVWRVIFKSRFIHFDLFFVFDDNNKRIKKKKKKNELRFYILSVEGRKGER